MMKRIFNYKTLIVLLLGGVIGAYIYFANTKAQKPPETEILVQSINALYLTEQELFKTKLVLSDCKLYALSTMELPKAQRDSIMQVIRQDQMYIIDLAGQSTENYREFCVKFEVEPVDSE